MSLWDNIGSRIVAILTDALGNAFGTLSNPVRTDPTGTTTQPVSVVSGTINATINNLDVTDRSGRLVGHVTVDSAPTTAVTNTSLSNLDVALSTRLKPADTLTGVATVGAVTSITNALPAGTNVIGHVIVDTVPTTAITAAALPLPSGAATAGNQATEIASLANLDVALSTRLKPADTLAGVTTVGAVTSITNALPAGSNVIGHVIVDTAPSTAITGTVAANQGSASTTPWNENLSQIGGNAVTQSVAGKLDVVINSDAMGSDDISQIRRLLELMLIEMQAQTVLIAQDKSVLSADITGAIMNSGGFN